MSNETMKARARANGIIGLHRLGLVDEKSFKRIMRHSLASEMEDSFLAKLERVSERKRELVNFVEWFV